jgi:simple sugar transport system permease protein
MIYALSGLCAAGGGILYAIGSQSGDASVAQLLELDAIAAVVIGGTLLSGGVGSMGGTLLGVLILGVITVVPVYEGDLNSWWTKIAIGGLLLVFIVLQRLLQRQRH